MKRYNRFGYIVLIGSGTVAMQGCPVGAVVEVIASECIGGDSISQNAFDELNIFEQLLYEENSCGRFEPGNGLLSDLLL